jgi:hypothetical protein
VIDYLATIMLFAVPRLLDWPETVTSLLTIMAFALLFYSLMTRYELAIFRLLPMRVHLALDILSAVLLIGGAFLFWGEGSDVVGGLVGLGIFELIVSFLTRPVSPVELNTEIGSTAVR